MAIEKPFVYRNAQSAIKLGIVFGVALIAAKEQKVAVFGYSPREVKCAVVGTGKASKEQILGTIMLGLNLSAPPTPQDAADALAIALCHARTSQPHMKGL